MLLGVAPKARRWGSLSSAKGALPPSSVSLSVPPSVPSSACSAGSSAGSSAGNPEPEVDAQMPRPNPEPEVDAQMPAPPHRRSHAA